MYAQQAPIGLIKMICRPRFLLWAFLSICFCFSLHPCEAFVRGKLTILKSQDTLCEGTLVRLSLSCSKSNTDWDHSYQLYLNHTRDTGDLNVPLSHPQLGNWIRMQRMHHKQYQAGEPCPLTKERLEKLEEAGFVFDVQLYLWKKSYDDVVKFYKDNGHSRVAGNPRLGRWASTQRRYYREGLLSEERQKLLEDVEFCWDLEKRAFENKIKKVKNLTSWDFREPAWDLKIQDGSIGQFMCKLRTRYFKYCMGETDHQLQEYQIDLLENELGMDCKTCKKKNSRVPRSPTETEWGERMDQLRIFREEHGHVNVPRTYTKVKGLGTWVAKVRERYVDYADHPKEYMQERVAELEKIGFVWDLCEYKWQRKFEELIDYYEQYGHVNVPHSRGSLGPWIREQRQEYQKFRKGYPSRLTPSHALALNKMGLDWNLKATTSRKYEETFHNRVNEYRKFCIQYQEKENRDNFPPTSSLPKHLKYWVEKQRSIYRQCLRGEKNLSDYRRRLLEEAGIVRGLRQLKIEESEM